MVANWSLSTLKEPCLDFGPYKKKTILQVLFVFPLFAKMLEINSQQNSHTEKIPEWEWYVNVILQKY